MQLKNLATVSFGVLLSVKAMAYEDEPQSVELTRIESNKKTLSDEKTRYKTCNNYRVNDLFAYDAAAIGPTRQKTAIFGSKIAPCKLQSLLDIAPTDAYVFSAALQLAPESLASASEKNDSNDNAESGTFAS
ncbi:hypothetical protein PMI22_04367 [Pseudomonas sp. GM21]|jgi:hypothetical protein|uniref:hypothetical protein n=1 Tax=Pseudomonas sp. GM21 TaxID=1144325 RepID=UPI000272651A|nr:hypothetical protein [Pseudomonas sp. GM21]EJM15047.1 hypothetical protein PMI22_04367 [Pseudomonas sp. GM21]